MEWKILPKKSVSLIDQILINRGINTKKEKENFFYPKLDDFEIDLKIPGIEKAKKRILQAVKDKELIVAFGDYDVDGICGAGILYLGLTSIGARVLPYIPHREKEGYGLSIQGLEFAKNAGAKVVITTDCGIVNFEEAQVANSLGLDLIITDHHQKDGQKYPPAYSVIHDTKMCGTAVAWCLVRNLVGQKEALNLLDLVAIATVSDMMPLLGVNRFLVKEGLKKINTTSRVGLLSLFNQANLSLGNIGSFEIGHIIAPRLNAMGRLEHAIDSLRLLCTKDHAKARRLTQILDDTNIRRQQMTVDAIAQARLQISKTKNLYVLSSKDWNAGIIGLVAGRICDETKKPVIAISIGEQFSKGSARSSDGINIVETIRKCEDLLVAVGGHTAAAGFTIQTSKIKEFTRRLENLNFAETDLIPGEKLEIDASLKVQEINLKLVKDLEIFEPFGISNPKPIFASFNMQLSDLRTVGEGKHLKGNIIIDFTSEGRKIPFIAFGMGDLKTILQNNMLVNMAYNLEIDNYQNLQKLQLKVKDLKPA